LADAGLSDSGPTVERIGKAAGAFEVGGDRRSRYRVYRMRDTPLDRLFAEHRISGVQFAATQKFRLHWFCGSFAGSLRSVDPDRVYAVDYSTMTGLARSQREAEHRDEYQRARAALGGVARIVIEGVACCEFSLEAAGVWLGYRSPFRARMAALELFCGGADQLAALWGIE
jgi:hypothetical protein